MGTKSSPVDEINGIKIHCIYDELVQLSKLKSHEKNRNIHTKDQIKRLAMLFEYHGIRHPIVVSKLSGKIVVGHGRKDAMKLAGLKEAPVVYQDFKDEEAEYAFLTSDNAIAAWSELDLSGINADLADLGPDFNIDLLGLKDFILEPAELDDGDNDDEASDPDMTKVCFVLSNEQNDIFDEAMAKAKLQEDCHDDINQDKKGNTLAAILRAYVRA